MFLAICWQFHPFKGAKSFAEDGCWRSTQKRDDLGSKKRAVSTDIWKQEFPKWEGELSVALALVFDCFGSRAKTHDSTDDGGFAGIIMFEKGISQSWSSLQGRLCMHWNQERTSDSSGVGSQQDIAKKLIAEQQEMPISDIWRVVQPLVRRKKNIRRSFDVYRSNVYDFALKTTCFAFFRVICNNVYQLFCAHCMPVRLGWEFLGLDRRINRVSLRCNECFFVCRYLGYKTSYDRVQIITREVDNDCSGYISFQDGWLGWSPEAMTNWVGLSIHSWQTGVQQKMYRFPVFTQKRRTMNFQSKYLRKSAASAECRSYWSLCVACGKPSESSWRPALRCWPRRARGASKRRMMKNDCDFRIALCGCGWCETHRQKAFPWVSCHICVLRLHIRDLPRALAELRPCLTNLQHNRMVQPEVFPDLCSVLKVL